MTFKPSPLPPFRPHIYTTAELSALLSATSVLKSVRNPLQPLTFRTLLIILYGTGMRVGEALRLSLRETDLHSRVLTVRDTKFFKSRLVPLGPRLTGELAAFRKRRGALPMPQLDDSAFFASSTGRALPYQHVITLFQRVRKGAGIQRDEGSSYPPRLHDLRHTAAVHRVIAWYRDGADVQRLLPQLATYLGHKDLRSTQHYLTMTPELLERASLRFLHYANAGGRHV
jgi:integrase/recombinase XerD